MARAVPSPRPASAGTLRGVVAVVTGGGRGIGRVVAGALAGAGAAVGLLARSGDLLAESAAQIRSEGGVAAFAAADVTDEDATAAALDELRHRLGPVDLLVNNAGVSGPAGATWEIEADAWWRAVEVNLRGTLVCTRLVMPGMVERGKGRIVNVTSEAGVFRWPTKSAYSVAKAAVTKLTENLAVEARSTGVTVFSVHPGIVPIGLSEEAFAAPAVPGTAEHRLQEWLRRQLDGGHGAEPGQVASLIVRIAAGEADALSGRHLSVHDDLDAMIAGAAAVRRDDLYVLRLRTPGRP